MASSCQPTFLSSCPFQTHTQTAAGQHTENLSHTSSSLYSFGWKRQGQTRGNRPEGAREMDTVKEEGERLLDG